MLTKATQAVILALPLLASGCVQEGRTPPPNQAASTRLVMRDAPDSTTLYRWDGRTGKAHHTIFGASAMLAVLTVVLARAGVTRLTITPDGAARF